MQYIEPQDLPTLFNVVRHHYTRQEQVPDYEKEAEGVKKLVSLLESIKVDDFYPDMFHKAAYLFIGITTGHFFSNGNKRLAFVCALVFLYINNYQINGEDKDTHRAVVQGLFPKYDTYQDFKDFEAGEAGLYNLAFIVTEYKKYDITFDSLKESVKAYFADMSVRQK